MQKTCSHCQTVFAPAYVYQMAVSRDQERLYFCSLDCRQVAMGGDSLCGKRARRLAILNHKGGTGKTTTAISVAAGLAERGQNVLLVDSDAQGNVGLSLGVSGEQTLYHVLVEGASPVEAAVPVRRGFDVVTSSQLLAAAEVWLAQQDPEVRYQVLTRRLQNTVSKSYDYVLVDCGPSLNLLNQNALHYADEVIIPVNCDYLSLVGVKQVLRTIREVEQHLRHTVRVSAVIPTFFDARTKLAVEVLETLQNHFKEKCLAPIRTNTKLAEAPSRRKTIFEHAPDSHGASDYLRVVDWVLGSSKGTAAHVAA